MYNELEGTSVKSKQALINDYIRMYEEQLKAEISKKKIKKGPMCSRDSSSDEITDEKEKRK